MELNNSKLEIKDLHVSIEGKEILKGVDLAINKGEVHSLMGPNGSGKSTLALALMGHPKYQVTQGQVIFKGQNILELEPNERARLGLFLAFQYPLEIPGVPLSRFLWTTLNARQGAQNKNKDTKGVIGFGKLLKEKLELLKMEQAFAGRYLNAGFSGGEKKRTEILQMAVLRPEIAILDEPDSGLDIDSVKIVAQAIEQMRGPDFGALVITHYQRILNYLKPDIVHVILDGRIVKTGGWELALELEAKGYDWLSKETNEEKSKHG